MEAGNLFDCLYVDSTREQFDALLETTGFKLERIVSHGHATPEGEWYDQERSEWVVLLKGSAGLLIEGEMKIRILRAGDYVFLPAHVRHRVEWTQPDEETVWLALHYGL